MIKFLDITRLDNNTIKFIIEKDECYGSEKAFFINTYNKTGKSLYNHIKKNLGKEFADVVKERGF